MKYFDIEELEKFLLESVVIKLESSDYKTFGI